jgi:hypothetical protein
MWFLFCLLDPRREPDVVLRPDCCNLRSLYVLGSSSCAKVGWHRMVHNLIFGMINGCVICRLCMWRGHTNMAMILIFCMSLLSNVLASGNVGTACSMHRFVCINPLAWFAMWGLIDLNVRSVAAFFAGLLLWRSSRWRQGKRAIVILRLHSGRLDSTRFSHLWAGVGASWRLPSPR